VIYTHTPVSEFTALSDTIALPPGYRRFLRLGLAKEISSAFDAGLTPELQMSAIEAKSDVKRANMRLQDLSTGTAGVLFGRRTGSNVYNIYSDR
jgi:hypothetical protein